MSQRKGDWQSVAAWSATFALFALAVVGMMSIGILILPLAIAAAVMASRRNRAWPEAFVGGLAGVGSLCLFVAFLHRNDDPCTAADHHIIVRRGDFGGCGGFDPTPWLVIGLALVVSGLIGYSMYRRTHRIISTV